jgi:two-component system NtrC family sensor kinase
MSSIRTRLIFSFTLAILLPAMMTCVVGVTLLYKRITGQAQAQVVSDLKAAREIYDHRLSQIKDEARLISSRYYVINALVDRDLERLYQELGELRVKEGLDVLTLTDRRGVVVCRTRNRGAEGDNESADHLVAWVLEHQEPVAATEIVSRAELMKESPELVAQAYMRFTPTPKAKPTSQTEETSGMMLKAAAPVFKDKELLGVLYCGVLLNRDYEIVDKVKETVFGRQMYKNREVGTATIFQGDLRISTNVMNKDGTRAITTRVSEAVYDAVLLRGQKWIDQAFVVNDWYITAYEPIYNIAGKIIGILYVGILKRPFVDTLWRTLYVFLGIALVGVVIVIVIAVREAKYLSGPLRQMAEASHRIAEGDYSQRIAIHSKDEIGYLAESLNAMTQELEKVHRELQEWGKTLEKKVEERTREIEKIQNQLLQSEKLASIGKLAAGVAHEINNPLTGILTNSSLMLEDVPKDDPRREDLETIVRETMRCREIVKGLLDFARQTKPEKKVMNINKIVEATIALVENQASFQNVRIIRKLDPALPETMVDTDQIRQVCINILINAAESMPRGGELTIESKLETPGQAGTTGKAILLRFQDTGMGMTQEVLSKIFDPFFTTKGTGTGLGLAISYGIIERHGGTIAVESNPGKGSTFTVRLPVVMS